MFLRPAREFLSLDVNPGLLPEAAGSDPALERIVRLAKAEFGVTASLITILDEHHQWTKAKIGTAVEVVLRTNSFCDFTVMHSTPFVVPDVRLDPRFRNHVMVRNEPFIRFYAGSPLRFADGFRPGALCVIDPEPRDFSAREMKRLDELAHCASAEIWMQRLEARDEYFSPLQTQALEAGEDAEAVISGPQIRAARAALGWSIADLAAASGTSPATIKRLEAQVGFEDVQAPRSDTVDRIRAIFASQNVLLHGLAGKWTVSAI